MNSKIKLLLTFDYELPMGSCKSYEKGLFIPSDRLLTTAKELDVPIVLFADICSTQMFKQWDYDNYYIPFKKQIHRALSENHDVQLHIHPHWLVSTFEDGAYKSSRKLSLHHFKDQQYPLSIDGIIENAVKDLTSICSDVKDDYKCIAFRAGGYCINPSTDLIFKALYNNGIRIDSSVIKNLRTYTDSLNIDHRQVPKGLNWYSKIDGGYSKEYQEEALLEIPITSMPIFPHYRIARLIKKIVNKELYKSLTYDHTGTGYMGKTVGLKNKITNAIHSPLVLSFDNFTTNLKVIDNILKYNLNKEKGENVIYFCANSHPKGFGEYQFQLFRDSILHIKSKYANIIEFTTFAQLYKDLKKDELH